MQNSIKSWSARFPRHISKVNSSDQDFRDKSAAWEPLIKEFEDALLWAASEGPEKYTQRHHARGMLSARDRISLILDDHSPFLELMPFAGYQVKHSTPCASLVVGVGIVHGIKVIIAANIPTIDSGSMNELTVKKILRLHDIAIENCLSMIYLNQSAGANLPQQFQVFHNGGKLFKDITKRSEAGAPTCTVVFGNSTAGGAYQPGMSDYNIFVKDQAQVFLGGPPLVEMAIGEVTSAEELGGAEMHTSVSGVGDILASDEFEACRLARSWVLSINRQSVAKRHQDNRVTVVEPPAYASSTLLGIIPVNIRQPLDMTEVIARLVDGSRFEPFKPDYGRGILCSWAYIHGQLTGIIGNQAPVIFTKEAKKATQFVRLNNASGTPIVYLHNVTGFMVGKASEQEGIIKAGSLFIDAVSRSKVPQISIICGSSYGAGNYAMCGRGYGPRFLFSWPQSRCSVMGGEQLAGVMEIIAREAAGRSKTVIDETKLKARSDATKSQIENESKAWHTSAWIIDDGIIDPRDTRDVLGMCLEICEENNSGGNASMRGVSRL